MEIIYSDHAKRRLKQRGITHLEVEFILNHPNYVKKSFEGRKEALGKVKNRNLKVIFIEKEKYIKIITVI